MKKLFLSSILIVLFTASSYAAETKINSKVVSNFFSEFTNAKNVSWTLTNNYLRAVFVENDKSREAFYDRDGNLIGVCTSIAPDQLPIKVKRFFAKKYAGYTVTEAIEFEGTEDKAYYVSAENDLKSLVLKVSAEGSFSVFKEETK